MKNLKIFAVAMMLLTAGTPVLADNDNGGDNKEKCEEIDNYDFLYSDDYDENFEFEPIDNVLDEAFSHMAHATAQDRPALTPSTAQDLQAMCSRTWALT